MNKIKVLKTTKLIKIFFSILILFSTSILFAQENSENVIAPVADNACKIPTDAEEL